MRADTHWMVRLQPLHPLIAVSVTLYIFLAVGLINHLRPDANVATAGRWLMGTFAIQIVVGPLNILFDAPIVMQMVHLVLADINFLALTVLSVAALAEGVEKVEARPAPAEAPESAPLSGRPLVNAYIALTKPRVISLLLFTTLTAMIAAQRGMPPFWQFLAIGIGGYMAAGAANAINMVIDRDILASKVTADGQIPAYGLVIKGIAGADVTSYDWAKWPMDKRVAEAKKLLAEAGIKPGTKISFTYNTDQYHKKMAIFAASEWKTKLGLETEMDNLEFKVLIKKRHDGEFQIARHGWVADYNDATTFLTLVQCDSDANDNKNCNRKAEELITQGNQSSDPVKRKALLTEAARLVMEDYPMIPLLQYTLPRLLKSYVGGYFESNPMDHFRSKDFYIIKH
jgi:hypothetical protein